MEFQHSLHYLWEFLDFQIVKESLGSQYISNFKKYFQTSFKGFRRQLLFYKRMARRCGNVRTTNSVESENARLKRSAASARPCMNIRVSSIAVQDLHERRNGDGNDDADSNGTDSNENEADNEDNEPDNQNREGVTCADQAIREMRGLTMDQWQSGFNHWKNPCSSTYQTYGSLWKELCEICDDSYHACTGLQGILTRAIAQCKEDRDKDPRRRSLPTVHEQNSGPPGGFISACMETDKRKKSKRLSSNRNSPNGKQKKHRNR